MKLLFRREVLKWFGALSAAASAPGCGDPQPNITTTPDASTDAGTDTGVLPTEDVPVDTGPAQMGPAPRHAFIHGVASGDPLPDAVMLWTRVTPLPDMPVTSVEVTWEVSTTPGFEAIVRMGTFTTNEMRDFTVKVDVNGLTAGTTYYYRFRALTMTSPIGRTRTAPTGAVDRLRLAMVACASMAHGYFHAYKRIAERLDLDAVICLGDYIYEYGTGDYGSVRAYDPPHECLNLADYRKRYAWYRRDADLRAAHQQHPFITVWDDHEFANNSYSDGAENHMPMTEGAWAARKAAAMQAYREWMPLRDQPDGRIFRKLAYGDLVDLIMLDTRIWARPRKAMAGSPDITSTDIARSLLGAEQEQWLQTQVTTSRARWKLLGQQVMMGQLTPLPNPDQWDGYVATRSRFYALLRSMMISNVVVLTGDIHTSWAFDLNENPLDTTMYDRTTGRGSLAVEFVTPGVSSPGLPVQAIPLIEMFRPMMPHMKYVDITERGYIVLDATPTRLQGAFFHIADVTVTNGDTERFVAAFSTQNNDNHLSTDTMAAAPRVNPPAAAPPFNP